MITLQDRAPAGIVAPQSRFSEIGRAWTGSLDWEPSPLIRSPSQVASGRALLPYARLYESIRSEGRQEPLSPSRSSGGEPAGRESEGRMGLKIVNYPQPVLLQRAAPQETFDESLRQTVDEMFDAMYAARGVGLAALQVAIPRRLFVVNVEVDDRESGRDAVRSGERVFVNPELLELQGEQLGDEGCLSIPGVSGQVLRAERVKVHAQGVDGEPFELAAEGYLARAIQHEYDHLEGRLFIDRLSPADKALAQRTLKELRATYESEVAEKARKRAGGRGARRDEAQANKKKGRRRRPKER